MRSEVRVRPLTGLPEITAGTDLGELIAACAEPGDDEIVVVSQKIVSKAEGRVRSLAEVEPGARAAKLGAELDKDPRLVQLILDESEEILRAERSVLITETRHGWVCANAGIDSSNVGIDGSVALLPVDPDASACAIRSGIRRADGTSPAVVIADSFGRAWRLGQVDVAIGCAGIDPLDDWRGRRDADGRELSATVIALADEVAAAADLVRDKHSMVPGAVISGLGSFVRAADGPGAGRLRRPRGDDLFR